MKHINSQTGAGLILFFMALILAGSIFLYSVYTPEPGSLSSQRQTSQSLVKAKQALISYAASYYLRANTNGLSHIGIHGLLPCPEEAASLNEGQDSGNCATTHASSLGRLPWLTLGTGPIKDAAGECLWYAVSGAFFNQPQSPMTNDDTPGMFRLFDESGNLIHGATPENRVAAVIIAPGLPLQGQNRPEATDATPCKVLRTNVNASDYLDNYLGINNSLVDVNNADLLEDFITSNGLSENTQLNDQIITITTDEIFSEIKDNQDLYEDKIELMGIALGNCLIDYAITEYIQGCGTLNACQNNCDNNRIICIAPLDPNNPADRDAYNQCIETYNTCNDGCRDTCNTVAQGGGGGKPPCDKPPCGKGGGKDKDPKIKDPKAKPKEGSNPACGTPPCGKDKDPKDPKGGGAASYYHFPWPADIAVPLDYRNDNNYKDRSAADVTADGLFGRLPFETLNSGGINNTIFDACNIHAFLPPESFRLWQHWKDHWFYVVGSDYAPGGDNSACDDCPEVNGTRYPAVLIFSDERINNQLRRSADTENPAPLFDNSKAKLDNFLEGSNLTNYPDSNGDKTYGDTLQNDRLFCIPANLTTANPQTIECP